MRIIVLGVMIDAIRACKIALDRGISGPLESISAFCFKHPPVQMPYSQAKSNFMDFCKRKKGPIKIRISILFSKILLIYRSKRNCKHIILFEPLHL